MTPEPQTVSAILTRPFPREAIKQRKGGGGTMLSYVEGHTVIHRLNEATGNNWSLSILDTSERTIAGQTLVTVRVALTIPGMGSREAMGVQLVSERGGEDLVKGAVTDALKKAATMFGVGLELYGPHYEENQRPCPSTAPVVDDSERESLIAAKKARLAFYAECERQGVDYRERDGSKPHGPTVMAILGSTGWAGSTPPNTAGEWNQFTAALRDQERHREATAQAPPAQGNRRGGVRQPAPPPDMTREELEDPFLGEEVTA